ncbi:DUF952 domain-containing protein [Sphingobium sp. H39-3-25]|uniref:DUF952 domain-containing protein n=1 Tax=Sphingobium arseniciresistens TaxID=3030834 RepID=UPI0023B9D056|nr:DUF952 domain-containing protein [Sphingobium arseniciresistens]
MTELFAYKILTEAQWKQLRAEGSFAGAPIDLQDGYIHMSTRAQTAETAAKHFAGQDRLVLAMVDLATFAEGEVRWETSRGGQLFPHLYAPLPLSAVTSHTVLRLGDDDQHLFPAGFRA